MQTIISIAPLNGCYIMLHGDHPNGEMMPSRPVKFSFSVFRATGHSLDGPGFLDPVFVHIVLLLADWTARVDLHRYILIITISSVSQDQKRES